MIYDMNVEKLRKHLKIGPKELINTNRGPLDILSVQDGKVTYGFLAEAKTMQESIEGFLKHFECAPNTNCKGEN